VTGNCTKVHQQIEDGSCSAFPNPHRVDLPMRFPFPGRRHRMSRMNCGMRGDSGSLHVERGGRMGSRVSYLLGISLAPTSDGVSWLIYWIYQLAISKRLWALTFKGEKPSIPGSQAPNNPNADSFNSVTIDLCIVSSISSWFLDDVRSRPSTVGLNYRMSQWGYSLSCRYTLWLPTRSSGRPSPTYAIPCLSAINNKPRRTS